MNSTVTRDMSIHVDIVWIFGKMDIQIQHKKQTQLCIT